MTKMPSLLLSLCTVMMMLSLSVEAATRSRQKVDTLYYGIDMDEVKENAWSVVKVTLACSPILAIVGLLLFSGEGEEEEKKKRDEAAKSASCKT
mmetsp:Transcript_8844/g.14709  ORF Transcript_8844/g.14709 Transcript_8844/m.14709 type:complete len:94 (-) Transcript_8844:294-575(-)|eukprot:CAMPEP_0119013768 /NCGR_PEP_ID=MMETSP1176-20130426/8929_1 /TAXON_ID=265551 /ORGANISM="Synedropsis recta cf, Strain CCMP1620" /LENGTH=93 /DNA_ID=CAMNT_0006966885 /DNA_START=43 /DNA_END=324 /DNA_ORIENTATION=+